MFETWTIEELMAGINDSRNSMAKKVILPSNYWEPTPDAEDYERMEREVEEGLREPAWPNEPLPFY